ncbi:hypothetical protein [Mesorhizobium sp.]|uniref:restriction endonuclease subunit S n=1 Tax=Mesorhizobium sp. TaxID=1871066 RepID=UPI0025F9AD5F|nr:hypothetical protein [Mesorhizobium sp.]
MEPFCENPRDGFSRILREDIHADVNAFTSSAHESYAEPGDTVLGDFIELAEERITVEPCVAYPQVGIRGFAGGLFFKEALLGSETSYKAFNRLSSGLFVVSQPKGWEGAVAVCDGTYDGWFASPEYRTFRCKSGKLEPAYLSALLPTPWFQYELSKLTRGQGARRERLRPEMLLGMGIRMPSPEKQNKALEAIEGLRLIPDSKANFLESVDALVPALLHQLFNGRTVRNEGRISGQDTERLILGNFGRHGSQVPARRLAR